jgi:hypothetical protein
MVYHAIGPRLLLARALGRFRNSAGCEGWRTGALSTGVALARFVRSFSGPSARGVTRARSLRLLKENLTPNQLEHFLKEGFFHVIGGTTGNRYRVAYGITMNVSQLDAEGCAIRHFCFYPIGTMAEGDVMLAQKLALELFELDALTVANKLHPNPVIFRRCSAIVDPPTDYQW